ncbi:MAG: hypothetical protein HYU97_00475 [Deltaproteobacteria bacterium]|nr:hypothetical protein [Deltaproteobacteria bacterium]
MSKSFTKLMVAGFLATLAMAVFTLLGRHFSLPIHFWVNTFSDRFGQNTLYGYLAFFGAGVIMAVLYSRAFHGRLPGTSYRAGILYGVMMWLVSVVAIAPALHLGFFLGSAATAVGTLAAYAVYGGILGYIHDA